MSDHALLVLWAQLASLLLAARLLGALANRYGQPAVAGELVAGLLLGPSVLGHLWGRGFHWLFPDSGSGPTLSALASISLLVLLVAIGAETDIPLIRRLGGAASWVSSVSFAVPLAAGVGLALLLPSSLLGRHGGRVPFVILIAGAVAVSSLPVIAKIVADLGLVRRNVGQLAIAAGTTQDAAGFVLVTLATGLAGSGGAGKVAVALIGVAGVSLLVLTAGQRIFDYGLRRVRRGGPNLNGSLTVCVGGALVAAAAMQAFGVEGALGAFVAGVALGRSRFQLGRAISVINAMTVTVFGPLYFSTAGLRVDLGVLGNTTVLLSFLALLAVALTFKFAGAALGGWAAGLPGREVLALGVGLNGRGALQVVIATAGLGAGILSSSSYTVVILMSLVASLIAPPLLRAALSGWAGSAEEQERLGREEQLERNVVVRGDRVLLATRGSDSSIVAAELLSAAWPAETAVTVLSFDPQDKEQTFDASFDSLDGEPGPSPAVQAILDVLAGRPLEHRHLAAGGMGPKELADEILAEANLGYGAIAVGASEERTSTWLLSPVLDQLVMRSPVPVVIVRRPRRLSRPVPAAFGTVLVPVSGTPSSRAGQEIACNVSLSLGTRVVLAHVVTRSDSDQRRAEEAVGVGAPAPGRYAAASAAAGLASSDGAPGPATPGRRHLAAAEGAAQVVLRSAWETAIDMGVEPEVMVRHGRSPGDEILTSAAQAQADVVALGTTVRQVEDRPFLGHTVEHVLAHSDATVVVVALPDHSAQLGAVMTEAGTT